MLNFKKFLNINIRQVVNFFLISKSDNKKLTFILFLILISLFISILYFLSPKLLNYSSREFIIKESLKTQNNIEIKKFKNINYIIFPRPRLVIEESSFDYYEGFILGENADIHIILNLKNLLTYKDFNYKNIIVKKSESKISINNITKSIKVIKDNRKKLTFDSSKFIFFGNQKRFFEINEAKFTVKKKNLKDTLNFKGSLLEKKIFINFVLKDNKKNNLSIRIPEIDSSIKIFFENNKSDNNIIFGLANIEILNNFFQFNFRKTNRYEIEKGHIRNKSINSSIKGNLIFKPNFYFDLYLEPNMLNIKDFFLLGLNHYLLPDIQKLNFIKKLNGEFEITFNNFYKGKVIFENGAISLKDFRIKKKYEIIKFETSIEDLNKSKKVIFNLFKDLENKSDKENSLNIQGFIIPAKNKVVFEKIFLDKKSLGSQEVKFYEKKFEEQIIKGYLVNIFNYRKFNNFFKNFKN